ncbi:winged helix-turn-helix transcriptional regulator [Pollutimonas harenae]|uniref:Transcriptional regulator n=1 Tax=Pollutimonas harenae TaxID=657015 RepID=A0A853H1N1_9BURK|nr:winged helix-turn-helix transcriptional regulator [Pollutimonas harenae]NYT86202.1 transcriptional regulator [Pollutimonas harenae]TEA71234.1 transcriptional regulator [Pollutimonas harenae]
MQTTKRTYDDGCAAAHALDLVGDRWALLIVRELLLGPKRFTGLRSGLPTISPNVLTQRLNDLEATGVLRRRKLPPPISAWVYELTDWGKALEPIMLQLVYWGVQSPLFLRGAPLGVDALVLSFKAMFDPSAANGVKLTVELHFEEDIFSVNVEDGRLHVSRGHAAQPAAILSTSPQGMLGLTYGKSDIDAAVAAGIARYSGERSALQTFFSVFSLPDPVMDSTDDTHPQAWLA